MRGTCFLVVLSFLPLCQANLHGAEAFPYKVKIRGNDVVVRSGPGQQFYATSHVGDGEEVQVYQRKTGGWLGIRPPQGSFSWVAMEKLRATDDPEVARTVGAQAAAWIGSEIGPVADHKWQVRLEAGEAVQIVGQGTLSIFEGAEGREYYQIAPPAGEFRWIHEDDVRTGDETVAKSPANLEIRLADFRIVDEEPAATSQRDGFVARGSSAAPRVASRAPAESTRPDVSSRQEFNAQLKQLELKLSLLAAQSADQWKLDPLLRGAQGLLDESTSTVERGKARLLLAKIQEFDTLQQRYAGFAELAAEEPQEPLASTTAPETPENRDSFDPRFDGRGWLLPVHSTRYSSPPYALLDAEGKILTFVSPSPGLNLHRYLRQQVGIFGQRSQARFLDKPHLTAGRVVELNRQQRRFDIGSLIPGLGRSQR
ncbi:MAG: hypothetical protein CMJ64_10695 [Planctomycetaceae bacterium]|nr:hypothetical protein [Planctomycetaceae bacterium]